jgi:hypothetical protein
MRELHGSKERKKEKEIDVLNPCQSKPEWLVGLKPSGRGRKIAAYPADFTQLLFVGTIERPEYSFAVAFVRPSFLLPFIVQVGMEGCTQRKDFENRLDLKRNRKKSRGV